MWRLLSLVAMLTAGLLDASEATSISIRAVNPNAKVQQPASFVGIGYNLLTADPDAAGGGGVDPGFLTTRRLVDLDPKGQESFPRHSCVTRSSTSTIYDEKSFQKKFDLDVSMEVGVSYKVVEAKFGLSTSFSEAKDQTTKERKMTLEKQTLCNLGGARMRTELDVNRASPGFQAAVCQLPDAYDQGAYVRFINDWGTNFVVEVDVGIRNLTTKTETFSSVFGSMQQALGVGASASVGVNAAIVSVSGSVEMNMNKLEKSAKFSESFKGSETIKVIGTQNFPEPIHVKVDSIHLLVTAAYFGSTNPTACTKAHLSKLSTKQANLARALEEYPVARRVHVSSSDGKVRLPLNWPRGTYGLIKPKTGCPKGWAADGQRFWHTKDGDLFHHRVNADLSTSPRHFDGDIGVHHNLLKFCVKTNPATDLMTDMEWPVGEYCIYQYRSCPKGFSQGFVYWDDRNFWNKNWVTGTMPDGQYDHDTKMFFCCRSDGHNTVPIFLPTDKPFYLLQANRYGCQSVAGMQVRQERIFWFDEGWNAWGGVIPFNDNTPYNIALYFCYYWK